MTPQHGAYSPDQIKAKARAHKRRFLRQIGIKAADLDAIASAYLDGWARSLAKVDLWDAAERDSKDYYVALNAARLWMGKLERRLVSLGLDRGREDNDPWAAYRRKSA